MSPDGPSGLSRELAALKRRGAALLVEDQGAVGDHVCTSLLGDTTADRRALFVPAAVGVADIRERWDGPETEDRFAVIDITGTRSLDTPTQPSIGDPAASPADAAWYERVPPDDPSRLLAAVRRRLDRLAWDEPPAATVRFCLDSLDPLYDELGEERLFRLLTTLCLSVTALNGMAHVHVSPGVPPELRERIEPIFDATIEVEPGGGGEQRQRWHLHEAGIETDWLAV